MQARKPDPPPRFVVDVMLGRLARWLRIIGCDTLYFSDAADASLARRALGEDRILLTRDVELSRRRGVRVVLISDDRVENQFREVITLFPLSFDRAFTRCLNCNTPLVEFERAQALNLVPPYVFATQNRFRRCPGCGKIYWRGTHWARMLASLENALGPETP